jgi:hypothetical protein
LPKQHFAVPLYEFVNSLLLDDPRRYQFHKGGSGNGNWGRLLFAFRLNNFACVSRKVHDYLGKLLAHPEAIEAMYARKKVLKLPLERKLSV